MADAHPFFTPILICTRLLSNTGFLAGALSALQATTK